MNGRGKEIYGMLCDGVVELSFTKVNGERRDMVATLNNNLIPDEANPTKEKQLLDEKEMEFEVIRCFDLKKNDWRSFRSDSLIEYKKQA